MLQLLLQDQTARLTTGGQEESLKPSLKERETVAPVTVLLVMLVVLVMVLVLPPPSLVSDTQSLLKMRTPKTTTSKKNIMTTIDNCAAGSSVGAVGAALLPKVEVAAPPRPSVVHLPLPLLLLFLLLSCMHIRRGL